MPQYSFKAKSGPDKAVYSEIEAESEVEAVLKISGMGLFPLSVQPKIISLKRDYLWQKGRTHKKEVTEFTRQFSALIDSGVHILDALKIILAEAPSRHLKLVLEDVVVRVEKGRSLSESLKAHSDLFSNLYTSIVYSGELSGQIGEALNRMASFLEKEEDFNQRLAAALTYPFFVLAVGSLTVTALIVFVVPRLLAIFEDMNQALPLPTKILIGFSDFLRFYWWGFLLGISGLVFFLRWAYEHPRGRILIDAFKLKLGMAGRIILKSQISRLMRTVSLLISGGLPLVTSLQASMGVVQNQVLRRHLENVKEKISHGQTLSSSLKDSGLFPVFVSSVIAIGEETGRLENSLLRIADDYQGSVERSLKFLTQMIEPVIILGMGLAVSFVVLAMLLPIFQINLIVK